MPRFAGTPVEPAPTQGPRFGGVPVETADFSGVTSRVLPKPPRTIPQELGRELGLGARGVVQGIYDVAGIAFDPLAKGYEAITGRPQATSSQRGAELANVLGLPAPETATERVGGGVTSALTGGGGFIGAGRQLAAQSPGYLRQLGQLLSAAPGTQVAGAATGSTASGLAREAGASPGVQTAAGVIGSIAPGTAIPVARAVARPVAAPFRGVTESGADTAVRDIIRESATDVDRLYRVAPSATPGVTRSLAEESLDPGIAALQRQYGSGPLREQASVANQARTEFITREFGGANQAAAQAFQDQASQVARQTARSLRKASGANIDTGVVTGIADAAASRTRRPEILRAIESAKSLVSQPFRTADEAWDARQGIDDLIRGKVSDQPNSKLAQKQLLLIRGALDRQMRNAYPEWGEFLKRYQGIQRQADQVGIGETLLERGGVTGLTQAGEATTAISPAKFRNLTDDLDQLAKLSTGFPKAKASGILTDQQQAAIQAVRDDVLRIAEIQRTGIPGSPTAQNLDVRNLINSAIASRTREILSSTPLVGEAGKALTAAAQRRVENRLQMILANPEKARELLRNAPTEDRTVIQSALDQFSATTATTATQGP